MNWQLLPVQGHRQYASLAAQSAYAGLTIPQPLTNGCLLADSIIDIIVNLKTVNMGYGKSHYTKASCKPK